jgi:hypothetical protein
MWQFPLPYQYHTFLTGEVWGRDWWTVKINNAFFTPTEGFGSIVLQQLKFNSC